MMLMVRLLRWVLKAAIAAVGILFVMGIGVVLFVAFTPVGGNLAAERISALVSTPDRKITFSRPEGLLSGDLRIDTLTLSDDLGAYAEIGGINVEWSPTALVSGVFRAEKISADTVNFIRPPQPPKPTKTQTTTTKSGSQLPVGIRVAQIDLPDINLAQALSGRDFALSLKGSIDATGPNISLNLEATRKDEADAKALADIVYAPSENRLTLKASVVEPQGGLLARLLLLPGAPAVKLGLDGEGPLSNWTGQLDGSVGDTPVISVTGKHLLVANGVHSIQITGGGQLATLMPPAFRALVDGTTDINIAATYAPSGRVDIQKGDLTSGAVKVSAKGAWDPTGDNSLTVGVAGTKGAVPFTWPINGEDSHFSFESINFTLTGAAASARFNATAALSSAELPQGRFKQIRLQAESEDLDLIQRAGSIRSRLTVAQLKFTNDDLNRLIKGPVTLDAPLRLAPPAIGLDAATFESAGLNGTISGAYDTSKQSVTGNFRLSANPSVMPPTLSVKFDGAIAAEGYIEASPATDRISLENIVVKSSALEAHGNVLLDKGKLNGRLAGRVPDIKKWLTDAEGAAGFDISAQGPLDAVAVKAIVNSAEARLVGRKLQDLSFTLTGTANSSAPQGRLVATGSLDGQAIRINADVQSANGQTTAPAITAEIGRNKLTGSLAFSPEFIPSGKIDFDFPDVSLLAALAAQQAQGDLHGSATFSNTGGKGSAVIKAEGSALRRGSIEILQPNVDLTIPNLKQIAAEGSIKAQRLASGANGLDNIVLGVTHGGTTTAFDLAANFQNEPLKSTGALQTAGGLTVEINTFSAIARNIPVELKAPTRIGIANGNARFEGLTLGTGDGRITVTGSAGSMLDLNATISALPAALINTFVPAINAAGTISGTINATGAVSAPSIRYDLEWSDAQFRQTRDAGIAPFHLAAAGRFADRTVTLDKTQLTGSGGLDLDATGRVVLNADGAPTLDINANAKAIPAALADAFAPGLGAKGTISGTVKATGTPEAPSVRYDLKWADAAVSQTATAGVTSMDVTANGTFAQQKVTLNIKLSGGGGIALSGGGAISLDGAKPLDLKFNGNFPFSVLAGQLAAQGLVLDGTANVDLTIGGTAAAPAISGTLSSSGSRLVDARHNLAITDLAANIALEKNRAVINRLGGTLGGGGKISIDGNIGIEPGSGFPADLRITLDKANYADGNLFAVIADGALTIKGPLTSGPVLGGRVTLTKASITVPAKLPTSLAAVDIRHRNAPADVLKQMEEIRPKSASGASDPIALDLQIQAPNGIFVRGRGIDAELGGGLTIKGNAVAPAISGGFDMRRGRIVILAKRLDFESGKITFGGGLVPILDLKANTTSSQTTITVNVTGIANDPDITFSSSPALPQDEVLARLIFGQSMSRLSPLQIAQLADAVSQLAGGGSSSLLETLRSNLGVDDLDISTDSTGQTTVSVGRYINNRTYFQVEQGGQNGAQATINLDVGRGVKLKAGAGTTGGTAGVFYEHEY